MLTITLYKNVPLQRDYANVLLLENLNNILTFLSPYQEGVIDNINKFFSNETFIDLPLLYEGCNYMLICDNRSNKEYKFFFIDNQYFVSGGAVRYEITIDVWATYSYNINFKPSRLIAGHLDVFNYDRIKRNLITTLNGTAGEISLENALIRKWEDYKGATLLLHVETDNGSKIFFSDIITSEFMLYTALKAIEKQTYYNDRTTSQWTAFKFLKVYLINDFNFKAQCDIIANYEPLYDNIAIGQTQQTGEAHFYEYTGKAQQTGGTYLYENVFKIKINEKMLFSNVTYDFKTNKLLKNYKIGSFLTNQKLEIDSETNGFIRLYFYLFNNHQIAIYLQFANQIINITNDFELPAVNDSYTLYMAQNQAVIDANNKANAINLATALGTSALGLAIAPATAGTSILFTSTALSSVINFGVNNMKRDAQVESAKNMIDRCDGIYSAGAITLTNGVGLWSYAFRENDDILDALNNFGTQFKIYVNTFVAEDKTLYNFYFVQYDDINIYGEFNYNIKSTLENIFKNGVRIWCDYSKFLNNINYKK